MKKVAGILACILLLSCITLETGAFENQVRENNYDDEPQIIRCTCYVDEGVTASGTYVRPNIMAARKDLIGCVACVNAVNPDGSVGEFIGYFEILDTGAGIDTDGDGKGDSIINGKSVDIYQPTMHAAEEWVDTYGDYVYIKIIRGEG